MTAAYLPARRPEFLSRDVRGLQHHFTRWPGTQAGLPPVVLLHGFMDCGATFQFVADEMSSSRTLLAPDWRGFGRTAWNPHGYWFPDYLADLDAMLEWIAPGVAVDLVGHSMGGNVALIYAGVRPERVRRLVTLEGFGLPGAPAELAPGRYRDWLEQWREPEPAAVFPGLDVFAAVLRRRNPRLSAAQADFVAQAWAESLDDGRVRTRFDPAHKRVNPVLYRRAEVEACWAKIEADVLYLAGTESDFPARLQGAGDPDAMRRWVRRLHPRVVDGAGHMLHHDQPAVVARMLDEFLSSPAPIIIAK